MKKEKIIKQKFNAMLDAIVAWKDEIARTLYENGHPFYVADDMREYRNPFVRVIEDGRAVHCVVDMVRSDDGINISAHKVSWDYNNVDEWTTIDNLGKEAAEFVLENILWLTSDDLLIVASDNHDGNLIDILNYSDVDIYFVHKHETGSTDMVFNGMVERVHSLDDYENASGWFAVHRYDYSQACKDVDEHVKQ